MNSVLTDGWFQQTLMGDFRNDKQMTLVQMCVRAYIFRACVRVSFVGECRNEKKLLTEQKKSHFYWQPHHQSPEGTMRPQAGGGVSGANGTPADGVQPLPKPRRGDRLFRHPSTFWVCHSFGVPFGVFHISRGSVLSGLHRLPVVFRPFGTLVVRLRIVVKKMLTEQKKIALLLTAASPL